MNCKLSTWKAFLLCLLFFGLAIADNTFAANKKKQLVATNPIDVEYAFTRDDRAGGREAADPMVVLFGDRYYLFATKNYGYWTSENMRDWTFVTTDKLPLHRFAPAVMVYKGELYWMGSLENKLYKTAHPEDGDSWTLASDAICAYIDEPRKTVVDPYLFVDDDDRVYLYWGSSMEEPLRGVELDPANGFRPKTAPTIVVGHHEDIYGWECRGDRNEMAAPSCSEGSAMLKHDGRYYMQYAGPGTQFDTYGDGVYTSNSPLGPFVHEAASPFSVKTGGWMTGAGHGNTFQDKYGNWWHVATTVISQRYKFERRIGFWPVIFTPEGRIYALSDYADMPYVVPNRRVDWLKASPWTGWMDLSIGKKVTASSQTTAHPAANAADFSIKTWWSAATGAKGEWLCVDLGRACKVYAIQTNFADEGFGMFEKDKSKTPYSYTVEASHDGKTWQRVAGSQQQGTHHTHELLVLDKAVKARYVRLTNQSQLTGAFSVYDLRVFGKASVSKPEAVASLHVDRKTDRRRIALTWGKSANASGYVLRWGIRPDELYLSYQTLEPAAELGLFSTDQEYYFRVDAFNDGGIVEGKTIVHTGE